jgi:three-Cys-motif partner protein
MAPGSDDFFREAKLVSRFKIRLVTDYVRPFFYKLGSWAYRVWVIDGFAGAGAYDPDPSGAREDGSPRALAKMARQLNVDRQNGSRRYKAQLLTINVEREPSVFAELEANLAAYRDLAENQQGEFREHLDWILRRVGKDPALFYLDPFGVRGIEMDLIERILSRPGKTELLIHFSDRSFKRMAGHLEERRRSDVGGRAAVAKIDELDRVMGTTRWRAIWADEQRSTDERMDAIVDLYCEQLRRRGIELVHDIRMRDDYYDSPRYRLVFATRSPHGTELMSDLACRYERELAEVAHDGSFALEWDHVEREERRVQLRTRINEYGAQHGPISLEEIIHALVPHHFGEFRKSDYAKCVRELVDSGAIRRDSSRGIKPRERLVFEPHFQPPLLGESATG